MNARELYNIYTTQGASWLINDHREIVLRALDLLARVEESPNLLIQRLYQLPDSYVGMKAAAVIVALRQHAEAMANGVEGKVYYADAPDVCEAVDAYRRDFPKDVIAEGK